ncbi:hypothetical protein PV327_011495, partial [Microctonus hyperodae]
NIIYGFCDTLPLIRNVTGKTEKNANTLVTLANRFGMDVIKAHNAVEDCKFLAKILIKLGISNDCMINTSKSMDNVLSQMQKKNEIKVKIKNLQLDELETCTTANMRAKMAAADISYVMIKTIYMDTKNIMDLKNLFGIIDENQN